MALAACKVGEIPWRIHTLQSVTLTVTFLSLVFSTVMEVKIVSLIY